VYEKCHYESKYDKCIYVSDSSLNVFKVDDKILYDRVIVGYYEGKATSGHCSAYQYRLLPDKTKEIVDNENMQTTN
jgi:hypothetical protein